MLKKRYDGMVRFKAFWDENMKALFVSPQWSPSTSKSQIIQYLCRFWDFANRINFLFTSNLHQSVQKTVQRRKNRTNLRFKQLLRSYCFSGASFISHRFRTTSQTIPIPSFSILPWQAETGAACYSPHSSFTITFSSALHQNNQNTQVCSWIHYMLGIFSHRTYGLADETYTLCSC